MTSEEMGGMTREEHEGSQIKVILLFFLILFTVAMFLLMYILK